MSWSQLRAISFRSGFALRTLHYVRDDKGRMVLILSPMRSNRAHERVIEPN